MSDIQAQPGSRLLSLPAEVRLLIYDELFLPIVTRPEALDTYALPQEWPPNNLSSYTNLTSVCKELRNEVKPHFEKHYLANVTFYFENALALYAYCRRVAKHAHVHSFVRFSLRSRFNSSGWSSKFVFRWSVINSDIHRLVSQQPGWQRQWRTCLTSSRLCDHSESHGLAKSMGILRKRTARNGRCIHVTTLPLTEHGGKVAVEIRSVCACEDAVVLEMRGRVSDINWDEFGTGWTGEESSAEAVRTRSSEERYQQEAERLIRTALGCQVQG